ncbi:hypothetical protein RRG08_020488 [Elysia crispata]|uniref:Uncharacterized protein n=1 Tax=Elysia crispata TaxID=231223 RepID=A0AAE0ZGM3_9GAST|nr:hypothetical protein RRG08_020488 [Elysia crispata]
MLLKARQLYLTQSSQPDTATVKEKTPGNIPTKVQIWKEKSSQEFSHRSEVNKLNRSETQEEPDLDVHSKLKTFSLLPSLPAVDCCSLVLSLASQAYSVYLD